MTAALAGLLLLALARGLARGYRAAFKATMAVMLLAGFGTLLKGLDWEETVTLGTIALAAWSQTGCSIARAAATGSNGRISASASRRSCCS